MPHAVAPSRTPCAERCIAPRTSHASPPPFPATPPPLSRARRGLVISPISFQSTAPGVGSTFLGTPAQLNRQYTRAGQAGVVSTRIYTTVGASGTAAPCNTPSCSYGGAVKALLQARNFSMTGACAARGTRRGRGAAARLATQPYALRCSHSRAPLSPARPCPDTTHKRPSFSLLRPPTPRAAVTVGVALPSLTSGGASFYTNATAITAFLSTFNTTVQTLMSYPELLMWCVRVLLRVRRIARALRSRALRQLLTRAVLCPFFTWLLRLCA